MKDLEKIQSPDLACQVADANPGNFAIEQEVGAMVGATVPAPTEPSADDARELGAQLLVFLRRALLPIRSALRTALAAIYAHLDSRCTDYTPAAYAPYQPLPSYDPMGTFVPRTLPNLLTAITAFAPRKISNGSAPNDGIKDGTSLAHLLGGAQSSVTEIKDDNADWTLNYNIFSLFSNATKFTLGCKDTTIYPIGRSGIDLILLHLKKYITYTSNYFRADYIELPELEEVQLTDGSGTQKSLFEDIKQEELTLPKLWKANIVNGSDYSGAALICNDYVKRLYMPSLTWFRHGRLRGTICNCANLEVLHMDSLTNLQNGYGGGHPGFLANCPKLIDLMIGQGYNADLYLGDWNPTNVLADADKTATFLQNFLEHICQRLANRTGQTKLTLTLSAGVYTAIMTDNDIKAELVARNWKVTDGTNNYNN